MYRMIAVGDSVMWGQGLRQEDKFFSIVVRRLREKGFDIRLDSDDMLAHSGAIIGDLEQDGTPVDKKPTTNVAAQNGEIPDLYPTIARQMEQIRDPSSVDIVLFDGGANDIGFMASLTHDDDVFHKLVRDDVDSALRARIPAFLNYARQKFPNALFFFTGYYPGLSPDSDIPPEIGLLLAYLAGFFIPIIGPLYALKKYNDEIEDIKIQGLRFHEEMLRRIVELISEHNHQEPEQPPITFVHPGFGARNAANATRPFVHGILEDDYDREIARERSKQFEEEHPVNDFNAENFIQNPPPEDIEELGTRTINLYKVANAHVGHPNVEGAEQYAEVLYNRMIQQLKFSLRDHLSGLGRRGGVSVKMTYSEFSLSKGSIRRLSTLLHVDTCTIDINFHEWSGVVGREEFMSIRVDLGFGPMMGFVVNYGGRIAATVDFRGNHLFRKIKHLEIRWPVETQIVSFRGMIHTSVNGTTIYSSSLSSEDFRRQGDEEVWRVSI